MCQLMRSTLADVLQGIHLRITNSIIQTIPEGTFQVATNITNATLEITNTTIHQWGGNTMDSFASVTVTNSIIERLNTSGILFRRRLTCEDDFGIMITFNGTTLGEVNSDALVLDRALLHITESTIVALNGQALRLGLGSQFRMVDTKVGALEANSLCQVCSNVVHFERNQLLHVPAHALHFGSPGCMPSSSDFECGFYKRRQVTTVGTRLVCGSLGWLRDALRSCGSISKDVFDDYTQFSETSNCSDRQESVQGFLMREPQPESEPEPAAGWWLSVGGTVGAALALVIGSLVLGTLAGRYCCRARGISGRRSFQPENGDNGITLPLGPTGGDQHAKDTADASAQRR